MAIATPDSKQLAPLEDEDLAPRAQPAWYKQLIEDLNASVATVFMLTGGGTRDYAVGARYCAQWLANRFAKYLDVVVIYNIGAVDEPISFPQEGMRKRYEEMVGRRQTGEAAKRPAGGVPDPFSLIRQQGGAASSEPGVKPPPTAALDIVTELLKFVRVADRLRAAVIIDRLDLLAPPSDKGVLPEQQRRLLGMLHSAGTDPEIENKGNPVVLLAPTIESVHSDLRGASSGIRLIDVPLPDNEARQQFISFVHEHYDKDAAKAGEPKVQLEIDEPRLAAMTAGLYRRHIHDVWLRGVSAGKITETLVLTRKNEIMMAEYAEVLETMQPRFRFDDIGGNEIVKAWLMKHIVQRMRTGKTRRLPKGVVFTGPSGTGKSLFAEALAAMLGINLVLLRPEKIKGGIYGETEQKTARAMAGIRANTPCVVFIDEIDQRFRRGGGGAGGAADAAEDSIFGRILEEIGDPGTRGQILWIGATNRPALCDAALFRPGRFDEKIPILPPTEKDRPGIFEVQMRRHASFGDTLWVEQKKGQLMELPLTPEELERTFKLIDWAPIVNRSDGWTGAEMEQAVISAYDLAELDEVPLHLALQQAVEQLRPSTRDIILHRDEALRECNRRELVPPEYQSLLGDEAALEKSQEELVKRDELRGPRNRKLE